MMGGVTMSSEPFDNEVTKRYYVLRKDGVWTGASFSTEEITKKDRKFHNKQGDVLVKLETSPILTLDEYNRPLTTEVVTKETALSALLLSIDDNYTTLDDETFPYDDKGTVYNMYNDEESIKARTDLSLVMDATNTKVDVTWKTADKDVDGVTNIYIILNVAEFLDMARQWYLWREEYAFSKKDRMKTVAKGRYNNPAVTVNDLLTADLEQIAIEAG